MELEGAARRAYSRRAFLLGAVSATTAGVLAACSQPSAQPTSAPPAAKQYSGQTVVYYGDGVGVAGQMEQAAAQQFQKDTGINIKFTQRPQDSTEALALYQRFFQGQSSDIDAFSIDVVWPGSIAQHL